MALNTQYNLDEFFTSAKKYYYFIDGMFKYKDILKKQLLVDLMIPESTYRANRSNDNFANKNHLKLFKHFRVNVAKKEYQTDYELLLTKIFINVYYRRFSEIVNVMDFLETCIQQNNHLKPIFVLFRTFIICNDYITFEQITERTKEDFHYLSCFPKEYYGKQFYKMYEILKFFIDSKKTNPLDINNSEITHELLGIYYGILANKYRENNKIGESILYNQLALKQFQKDFNITRMTTTASNIGYLCNHIFEFDLSILNLEPFVEYISYQKNSNELDKFNRIIIFQYLYALFMSKKFDKIIRIFEIAEIKKEMLTETSICILLFTLKHLKINYIQYEDYFDFNNNLKAKIIFDYLFNKKKLSNDEKNLILKMNYVKTIIENSIRR